MLGDRAAGHAAPVEANEISVVVLGDRRELDPLAGGWVEDGSEPGGGDVLAGGAVQGFGAGHELARFCGVCGVPFRVWYQATVAAMAVARGGAGGRDCGLVLGGVEHERLVELVGQFYELPEGRVE